MYETPKHQTVHDNGGGGRKFSTRDIITAVVAVLAVVFVLQNTSKGSITFWFWDITAPAWIWLIVLFLSGVAVGSMAPWLGLRSRKKKP